MKKGITLIFFAFIAYCCKPMEDNKIERVSYTSSFHTNSKSNPVMEKTFTVLLPRGFKVEKEDFNPEYKEIVFNYSNSSKIYITDNSLNGSSLNGDNKLEQSITIVRRKTLSDSVYMKGKQKDGKYWREDILNDIVIGYLNVPEDLKAEFDKAISTLSIEEDFERTLQHELIHSKQE